MLLKEISSIASGQGAPQSKEDYCKSGYTFIKASDLDIIIEDQNEDRACKVTDEAFKRNKLYLFPQGTIVFAKSGMSCLKNRVYVLKEASCVVNHLCCISNVDERFDANWIALFLKHYNVTRFIKDNAYPSISLKDIGSIVVPAVDKSLQMQIVKSISNIQHAIDLKRKQLTDLDELVKSKFQEMFGDPLENEKGWKVKKLEEIVAEDCPISYGIVQPGEGVDDGVPVVRPVDMINTYVSRQGLKQTTKEISDLYKRTILKGNEILLCVRGTTGMVALATEELKGCNVTRGITPIEFNEQNDRWFVFYQFLTNSIQRYIAEYTRGAALKQINMKDVREIPLIVPPMEKQICFAKFAQRVDSANVIINKEIANFEELLESKMDEYFGEKE